MAEKLELLELTVEIERAIWQVEASLRKAKQEKVKPNEEARSAHVETNVKSNHKQ